MRALQAVFVTCLLTVVILLWVDDTSSVPGVRDHPFTEGDGSFENPYGISDLAQLDEVRGFPTDHFVLLGDIDASDTIGWDLGKGFEPIGLGYNESSQLFEGVPFRGSIDGMGHSIMNLHINRGDVLSPGVHNYIGLISYNMGTLRNIRMVNAQVWGDFMTGSLCGLNNGMIDNCTATGNVEGNQYTGSLTGGNYRKIEDSKAVTEIRSGDFSGGIAGANFGEITNCGAVSQMETGSNSGGICGESGVGEVVNCTFSGEIEGKSKCGGILGNARSKGTIITVKSCKVENSSITGDNMVGGIAGMTVHTKIEYCGFSGTITGKGQSAGAVGVVGSGSSVGSVTSEGRIVCSGSRVGGIAGELYEEGVVGNAAFTGNITGSAEVGGIVGFCLGKVSESHSVADMESNEKVGGICGTLHGSLENSTSHGDITGVSDVGGCVGYCNGEVIFCTAHSNISGDNKVGGFSGTTSGHIENCGSMGIVTSEEMAGGFTCGISKGSSVMNSYSWGEVRASSMAGGFVAENRGEIENCYTFSGSSTNPSLDGFAGTNAGDILNCYSAGEYRIGGGTQGGFVGDNNGNITGCFWNMETNEQKHGVGEGIEIGVTGLSTEEMTRLDTYFNWDLDDIWSIWAGYSYPRFYWQKDNAFEFTGPPENSTMEDSGYNSSFDWADPDPTDVHKSWKLEGSPDWISIEERTGLIYGISDNGDVGVHNISVIAEDQWGVSRTAEFRLEVLNVNDPPRIEPQENITIQQDEKLELDLVCTDIDPSDDMISWFLDTNSSWIGINRTSGVIYGMPQNSDVGDHPVTISVDDNMGGTDVINFTIHVKNVNDPPENLSVEGKLNYTLGMNTYLTADCRDPDLAYGDNLNFTWRSNISGIIGYGREINVSLPLGVHSITLTVVDDGGLTAEGTLEVTVSERTLDDEHIEREDEIPWGILIAVVLLFLLGLAGITIYFLVRRKTEPVVEMVTQDTSRSQMYSNVPDQDEVPQMDNREYDVGPVVVNKGASSRSLLDDLDMDEE